MILLWQISKCFHKWIYLRTQQEVADIHKRFVHLNFGVCPDCHLNPILPVGIDMVWSTLITMATVHTQERQLKTDDTEACLSHMMLWGRSADLSWMTWKRQERMRSWVCVVFCGDDGGRRRLAQWELDIRHYCCWHNWHFKIWLKWLRRSDWIGICRNSHWKPQLYLVWIASEKLDFVFFHRPEC